MSYPHEGVTPQPSYDSKLKICVIGMHYAPEPSGNAPYTTGMAEAFLEAGHDVRVITGYPHYPQWKVTEGYSGSFRRTERLGGVNLTRVRHPVPSSPGARQRVFMDSLFSLHASTVRMARPDVVIVVSPVLLSILSGLRWKSRGRTALGVVAQDLYSRALIETGMASGRVARWGARLERALLDSADGVALVHNKFYQPVKDLGVDPDKLTVIPNWAHIVPASDGPSAEEVRRRFGWGSAETIALHAGNMGTKQGLENVVEAACLAAPGVRFVLLGDGGRRSALVAAAERRGVGDRLQFVDPLSNAEYSNTLRAADVLVVNEAPTVAEMSAPSKLTSYFSAGRPVVAASWGHSAASAEIEKSQAGVRVDPGNPGALLHAVKEIGEDPRRAAELGARAQKYAKDNLGRVEAYSAYQRWVLELADRRILSGTGSAGPTVDAADGPWRSSLRMMP